MNKPARLATLFAAALLLGAPGVAAAAPAPPPATGSTGATGAPQIATLRYATDAVPRPDPSSGPPERVSQTRPITGERTALPVIARALDKHGSAWLEVLLPGRPNGHAGWIRARSATLAASHWGIAIRTSTRRISVFRDGRLTRVFRAVVGKPSTPTPAGEFFVEESVALSRGDVGAPFALALSARSNVLQEFAGGPGQIALHGTNNVGGVLGTAVSHGCVRLDTRAIAWLAARIPTGTRVTVTR